MALIGYARVSTEDQDTLAQVQTLKSASCMTIFEDTASGGNRERPSLKRAIARVRPGDTLIVVRIDRLARSLTHLLEIVETLRANGAYFRSILNPIDTSSAQGILMTQMLGTFTEFERALIRERTKASLQVAMQNGARPGNPKMRAGDPAEIANLRFVHKERYLHSLIDEKSRQLPTVERLRPHLPWALVLRQVRSRQPPVRTFSERMLVKRAGALGLLEPTASAV